MNAPFSLGLIRDTLENLVSNLGTAKDKNYYNQFTAVEPSRQQLEFAYRGDWVARKVCDIPAQDATREWREWNADKKDIKTLKDYEKRMHVAQKVRRAMTIARLYGGAALVIGTDAPDPSKELVPETVGKDGLKYLHVANRFQLTARDMNLDVTSDFYGTPKFYEVQTVNAGPLLVHPSRVVRFVGKDLPAIELNTQGWGDSVLMALDDAIKHVGVMSQGIAALVQESKMDIIKIPNLGSMVSTEESTEELTARLTLANKLKSILNTLVLDKEEDWERITVQFGGMEGLLHLYLQIASGASDIPTTRLLGQSAKGLNATGVGDARNYYDGIGSMQETEMSPLLEPLDQIIVRSALGTKNPEDVDYSWVELWEMDEPEKATVAKSKADTFNIDVQTGLFTPEVLRKARESQLIEDGTYPALEQAIEDEETAQNQQTQDPAQLAQFAASDPSLPVDPSAAGTTTHVPTPGFPGLPPTPVTSAPAVATEQLPKPQDQGLNGAQISSLAAIVEAVVSKQMPPETAKAMISVSFPVLEEAEINNIIDPLKSFEPPKPDLLLPAPAAPGAGGPVPPPTKVSGTNPFQKKPPPVAKDAQPRTLYVRRDVVNRDEILAWAKDQGLAVDDPESLHVTIVYSRSAVDWIKMGEAMNYIENGDYETPEGGMMIKPGGPRVVERLGPMGDAVALLFASSQLCWRHEDMVQRGASHDWEDYNPHITLSGSGATVAERDSFNISVVSAEPYRGRIILGPEIFEEVRQ